MSYRLGVVEEQVRVFAPLATTVAIHDHQLDEGEKRMKSLEASLTSAHSAVDKLVLKVEGLSVKLAVIVGVGALLGGGVVTAAVQIFTS